MAKLGKKWSKARREAFEKRFVPKGSPEAARRASAIGTEPLEGQYAGQVQTPTVDINKIERHAFRHGIATALQVVFETLMRELR